MPLMQQVSYQELQEWKASGKDFQLIDVREPEEHSNFNIGGILIPLPDIMKALDQLDTSRPIVVYCKRGIRSQIAIQRWQTRLPEANFYNLEKGIFTLK